MKSPLTGHMYQQCFVCSNLSTLLSHIKQGVVEYDELLGFMLEMISCTPWLPFHHFGRSKRTLIWAGGPT